MDTQRPRPHFFDAAPLGPLVEPWPDRHTWVCIWLDDRWRILVGPRAGWSLSRQGWGRVAQGVIGEA